VNELQPAIGSNDKPGRAMSYLALGAVAFGVGWIMVKTKCDKRQRKKELRKARAIERLE
jgi:2-keto-3-deoxy-6-phosphogluconate aldolase